MPFPPFGIRILHRIRLRSHCHSDPGGADGNSYTAYSDTYPHTFSCGGNPYPFPLGIPFSYGKPDSYGNRFRRRRWWRMLFGVPPGSGVACFASMADSQEIDAPKIPCGEFPFRKRNPLPFFPGCGNI